MLAVAMREPALALSKEESTALAQATANVARWYSPIKASGKNAAWFALVTTAGMIYAPRIIVIARNRAPKQVEAQDAPATVEK